MPHAWNESDTRAAVAGRSGGICEGCCAARACDMHHRVPRSLGGKWIPANILHLCRPCHNRVTETKYIKEAEARGLSLRSYEDPENIPVQRLTGETTYLSNDVSPPLRRSHGSRTGKAAGRNRRRLDHDG